MFARGAASRLLSKHSRGHSNGLRHEGVVTNSLRQIASCASVPLFMLFLTCVFAKAAALCMKQFNGCFGCSVWSVFLLLTLKFVLINE